MMKDSRKYMDELKLYSHPIANCPKARDLYFAWTKHKKGTADYEKACLKYKWHIANCEVCQGGLRDED